ncbi:MAG: sucrose-6-phosphate hydrolase [Clostridia bacterium]|nr:sucrose-6-phosphate hydrolase [Clostridia bacterium]
MKTWTKEERYRVLKSAEEIRALHESIARSDYRQQYHIQPVTGLLNDPNGFVFHDGVWHLFYQWCPWGAVHGLKYWYHTVSKDLVTWKNMGVCIRPDTEYDNKGAYSGSALPTGDSVYLYYTGNHRDEDWTRRPYTCLVNLKDDGTAEKLPPLFGPNPAYTEHQRDPKIIHDEKTGKYYLVIGAQTKEKKGCVIVYVSDSPTAGWRFAGQLKVPGFEDFGDMWECPSIETISGYDVLIFCPQHLKLPGRGESVHHNGYLLGHMNWETLTFTPDNTRFHVLDFGFDSYAAECAANPNDRNKATLVAWMGLPDASYPTDEEDWSGCLTLPRELRVRDRRLIQQPLDALRALRGNKIDLESTDLLPRVCELELISRGGDLDLQLFARADGSGGLRITYDDAAKTITVDRSGMAKRFNIEQGEVRVRPLPKGLFHLRIFVDRSSIEIFVNDGDAVFSSRIFPTAGEKRLFAKGDASIHLWELCRAVVDDFAAE